MDKDTTAFCFFRIRKEVGLSMRRSGFVWMMVGLALARVEGEAATESTVLRLGQSYERELKGGETHAYTLVLEAGQSFFGVVQQNGIDVRIRVYDPDKKRIADLDSPNGSQGPEPILIVAKSSGMHTFEIIPLDAMADSGCYVFNAERIEAAATTPAGRLDRLFAVWDKPDSPGASVTVVRDGKIVYKRGFGSAQLEYGVPITPSTVFHVASVSKQFTAFAVVLLAARGEISLDEDIRAYLPDIPDFGREITVRHLIHHTSGMRDQWNLLAMAGWRLDDVITREQIMKTIKHQKDLNFDPGEEYLYCNTGYTLLAEMVSRISGISFREWTSKNLFKPLGMNDTHFHDDHRMIVPNRAYSYRISQGRFVKSVLSYANVGATSLFTTVEDLAKWAHNLDTGKVGGPRVIEQMEEKGVLNDGTILNYAFGLGMGTYRGLKTVGHGGADAGFRSHLIRFPDHRLAVAVLSNLAGFDAGGLARKAAEIYLDDEMDPEAMDAPTVLDSVKPFRIPAHEIEEYTGIYYSDPWRWFTVTADGGRLFTQEGYRDRMSLVATSDSTFYAVTDQTEIVFRRDEAGDVRTMRIGNITAERGEPFEPESDALMEYAGDYYSEELGTFYTIRVEDGRLVAGHRRHVDTDLSPTLKDYFYGNNWWLQRIAFTRGADNRIYGFCASNGRVRNLKFSKGPL